MGVWYSATPPVPQITPPHPLLDAGPGMNAPPTPFWGVEKRRLTVSPRLPPPSEPQPGAASGAMGPTGTMVPVKEPGATGGTGCLA